MSDPNATLVVRIQDYNQADPDGEYHFLVISRPNSCAAHDLDFLSLEALAQLNFNHPISILQRQP